MWVESESWPGAARTVSARFPESRLLCCQQAFPGQPLQSSLPLPPLSLFICCWNPHLCCFAHQSYQDVENWGKSCFPVDLRVASSQVTPKSFTSFESLTGWNFGSSRAMRSTNPPCKPLYASRTGPRLLKKCRCHNIGRMLMVSTLTLGWFYLLNNLMKALVFGATNNSGKQKEPTCPIIMGNEFMISEFEVCICIL